MVYGGVPKLLSFPIYFTLTNLGTRGCVCGSLCVVRLTTSSSLLLLCSSCWLRLQVRSSTDENAFISHSFSNHCLRKHTKKARKGSIICFCRINHMFRSIILQGVPVVRERMLHARACHSRVRHKVSWAMGVRNFRLFRTVSQFVSCSHLSGRPCEVWVLESWVC